MTLEEAKVAAKKYIDVLAETSRQRFISPGAGQIATYQEKSEEAIEFVAAGYPVEQLSNYPFIQAEVVAMGLTPQEVADGILTARSLWITAGAAIEGIRLATKAQVTAAESEDQIRFILDAAAQQFVNLG